MRKQTIGLLAGIAGLAIAGGAMATTPPKHSEPEHVLNVAMPDGTLLNRFWDANDTPRPESYAEDVATAQRSGRAPGEVTEHARQALRDCAQAMSPPSLPAGLNPQLERAGWWRRMRRELLQTRIAI